MRASRGGRISPFRRRGEIAKSAMYEHARVTVGNAAYVLAPNQTKRGVRV